MMIRLTQMIRSLSGWRRALLARGRKHGLATPVLEIAATHLEAYAARKKRESAS